MYRNLNNVVWRHKKENVKKCTVNHLAFRDDFAFFTYPKEGLPKLSNHIFLTINAPPISKADSGKNVFLIDSTWKYASIMEEMVSKEIIRRSIPEEYVTAYPRRQTSCISPKRGLASIEAIYVAFAILGKSVQGLLDCYYWKNEFLNKNANALLKIN